MKEFAFVYHYWGEEINSLEFPILPSIATLRFHTNLPIYVLDYKNLDWKNFDKKLNFQIIKSNPVLERQKDPRVFWRLCSLPFDSYYYNQKIEEQNIFKTDVDVVWLKDPLPIFSDNSRFCCRSDNTGIFYFDKKSPLVKKVFSDWKEEIIRAIESEEYKNEIWRNCNRDGNFIYEEIVLYNMIKNGYDLTNLIPWNEHYILSDDPVMQVSKNIHLVKRNFYKKRGIVFILMKESKEILLKFFNKEEIDYIFQNNFDKYKNFQFEFKNTYQEYDNIIKIYNY
jgi:hypothetical protein